jgi:hypothetical protein
MALGDAVGGGFGAELEFGVRFAKYFTPFLIGGLHGFGSGDGLEDLAYADADYQYCQGELGCVSGTTQKSTAVLLSGGLGLRIGSRRGKFGGYGEIGFLMHSLQIAQEIGLDPTPRNGIADTTTCTLTRTYAGPALRLGGGVTLPLGSVFHLSPFVSASFGQFSSATVKAESPCEAIDYAYNPEAGMHSVIGLGVAGEFQFGADKPGSAPPPAQ